MPADKIEFEIDIRLKEKDARILYLLLSKLKAIGAEVHTINAYEVPNDQHRP